MLWGITKCYVLEIENIKLYSMLIILFFDRSQVNFQISLVDQTPYNFGSVEFSFVDIFHQINKLEINNKGSDPDEIPSILLIRCSCLISYVLEILFNKSLSKGILSVELKSAFVTPRYKSDYRNDIINCGPISILSVILKLFGLGWVGYNYYPGIHVRG